MKITDAQLENWFTYHSPKMDQVPKYQAIREAGKHLARTIVENCPEGEDAAGAVWKVREAVMAANQAIACDSSGLEDQAASA